MDTVNKHMHIDESQAFSPIKGQQPSSMPVSENSFPVLAIAVLGIMATAFLLISYYIFVTKCCFNCQQIDPLRRFIRRTRQREDPLMAYSPSWQSRGLDEILIRQLPAFQYTKSGAQESSLSKCVVCLNEFQDQEMLRLLPKCSHAFHLDCIDVWLQSNTNCPLCRSSISGRNRYPIDRIIAPNSSPQDPQPYVETLRGGHEEFVLIDFTGEGESGPDRSDSSRQLGGQSRRHSSRKFEQNPGRLKTRKFHHVSIMGDECFINGREKDEQFSSIQPIRRSFSMDSAADRHVYLSVQEIIRQNNEESSSRARRSIFSFGHGRGSRSAVLPLEF